MGWVMSSPGMVRMGIWVTEPLAALDDTGALVQAGQVRIQVAGEALTAGDLALGGGELAQSLAIAGHIGQDDQHVLVQVKGQVLGRRQGSSAG